MRDRPAGREADGVDGAETSGVASGAGKFGAHTPPPPIPTTVIVSPTLALVHTGVPDFGGIASDRGHHG